MVFVKVDKKEYNDLTKVKPLIPKNKNEATVQSDTDSVYVCFEEYRELFPGVADKEWFYSLEEQMNVFWSKILEIKAKKNSMPQLIMFARENIFTNFFSFAKKMYMGDIVDSEGELHWENPKPKIQGIALKRTEIPEFCQEKATELCFNVMRGMTKELAESEIIEYYKQFKEQNTDKISANRGVHKFNDYAEPTEYYLKNGISFKNKTPFNVKSAIHWNYVCAMENLGYEPIGQGAKFSYVFLLPSNKYGIDNIAYMGSWPKEFNDIFEIDYETCFRKFFLPCPEGMFKGLKWLGEKEDIPLKINKFKKFF